MKARVLVTYLCVAYLTTQRTAQITQRRMVRRMARMELARVRKGIIVA
jgi:hypothetical protein